jgi:hypothetical protein
MKFEDDGMSVRQQSRVREQQQSRARAAQKTLALEWIKLQALVFGIVGVIGLAALVPLILATLWFLVCAIRDTFVG